MKLHVRVSAPDLQDWIEFDLPIDQHTHEIYMLLASGAWEAVTLLRAGGEGEKVTYTLKEEL